MLISEMCLSDFSVFLSNRFIFDRDSFLFHLYFINGFLVVNGEVI